MNAHVAHCPGCDAALGIVFHLGEPSSDDMELVAWWLSRGFRVEEICVPEAAFALGRCACAQERKPEKGENDEQ